MIYDLYKNRSISLSFCFFLSLFDAYKIISNQILGISMQRSVKFAILSAFLNRKNCHSIRRIHNKKIRVLQQEKDFTYQLDIGYINEADNQ
jgi:hypothetical protein